MMKISNRALVAVGSLSFAAALVIAVSSDATRWGWFRENAIAASLAVAPRDRPAVVLVFRPRDCGSGIESLALWNAAYQRHEASVIGLVVGAGIDSSTLEGIRSGAGLRFPLRVVSDAAVEPGLAAIGYHETPIALIADRSGRVRSAAQLDFNQGRTARHLLRELHTIAAEHLPEVHTVTVTQR